MMLDSALMAAILEDPDADLPRLIAADWFDEQGECERAEFVRVQCELAENICQQRTWANEYGPGEGDLNVLTLRAVEIRRRERELLSANGSKWFPLASLATQHPMDWYSGHHTIMEVRRGWPHTIRCTAAEWQRSGFVVGGAECGQTLGQHILRQHPVERVEFTDCDGVIEMYPAERPPEWTLRIIRNVLSVAPIAVHSTRDTMIDAMPQQLREWGVDESGFSTYREYIDGVEVTVDRPLYARQNSLD